LLPLKFSEKNELNFSYIYTCAERIKNVLNRHGSKVLKI